VSEIYRVTDIERAQDDSPAGRNEPLSAIYQKMKKLGGDRYLVKPSSTEALESLYDDCPNFAEVLDEVDKAGGDSRYDPMGPLYGLLERDTARKFRDEFIEVDIDASHIQWVSTANDARSLSEPILNRMNVYSVPRPNAEQAFSIACCQYAEIIADHHWGFPPQPPADVMAELADMPPRDMRKRLMVAFGNAKLDGRDELQVKDLDVSRVQHGKTRIGF
jgi:ATP-dependent Lon protease